MCKAPSIKRCNQLSSAQSLQSYSWHAVGKKQRQRDALFFPLNRVPERQLPCIRNAVRIPCLQAEFHSVSSPPLPRCSIPSVQDSQVSVWSTLIHRYFYLIWLPKISLLISGTVLPRHALKFHEETTDQPLPPLSCTFSSPMPQSNMKAE